MTYNTVSCPKEREIVNPSHRPAWDIRFQEALERYSRIEGVHPEIIPALASGLRDWAALLPQIQQDTQGYHLPVNSWGLGPEKTEIFAIADEMALQGKDLLSQCLLQKFQMLRDTVMSLDQLYPKKTSQDDAAEIRLVQMAQRQTAQLIAFLMRLEKIIFKVAAQNNGGTPNARTLSYPHTPRLKSPKRSHRASAIELLEKELIAHIQAARDHAQASLQAGSEPTLLPRPTKQQLALQANIKPWTLSRCFQDPQATQLCLLWQMADDLDQIMRFTLRR